MRFLVGTVRHPEKEIHIIHETDKKGDFFSHINVEPILKINLF